MSVYWRNNRVPPSRNRDILRIVNKRRRPDPRRSRFPLNLRALFGWGMWR